MNIFFLTDVPFFCAQYHCDKHVLKMLVEYAQLMSTAHRVLDGELYYSKNKNGRLMKCWRLNDDREKILYKATHVNHPCSVWVRENEANYSFIFELWYCLLREYVRRYCNSNMHKTGNLLTTLYDKPTKIKPFGKRNLGSTYSFPFDSRLESEERSLFLNSVPLAMPDQYKIIGDPIRSYRNFYISEKSYFAKWKDGPPPFWFPYKIK